MSMPVSRLLAGQTELRRQDWCEDIQHAFLSLPPKLRSAQHRSYPGEDGEGGCGSTADDV
jgi:hypothetical protein